MKATTVMNSQGIPDAVAHEECDAWARHAHTANGFGDVALPPTQRKRRVSMNRFAVSCWTAMVAFVGFVTIVSAQEHTKDSLTTIKKRVEEKKKRCISKCR